MSTLPIVRSPAGEPYRCNDPMRSGGQPGPSPDVRLLLLDWGGTLCRYVGFCRVMEMAAARLGRSLSTEELSGAHQRVLQVANLARVIEAQRRRNLDVDGDRAANAVILGSAGLEEFANSFSDVEQLPTTFALDRETNEFLRAAKLARIAVGIVSNCGTDIRAWFTYHHLDSYIDGFFLSYEIGCAKPDPGIFLAACDKLEVSPAETLMVGDSDADGGAINAGITTILLPRRSADAGLDRFRVVYRLLGLHAVDPRPEIIWDASTT